MEPVDFFLFMMNNDSVFPAAGESELILFDLASEVIDDPVAHRKMGGADDIAQEVAAIVNRRHHAPLHIQLQLQMRRKKVFNPRFPVLQLPSIIAQQHQIIHIAQV